jgi:creatinine amidohydrolase
MGYSIFDDTMVDMTWPEIEQAIQQKAGVLLPVGVIEEHGPHMSLAVDIYVSYRLCTLIKTELEKRGIRVLIAPPFYWGINTLTGCFPGSFSVRPETMKAVLYDTLAALKNWGVEQAFTVNWHAEYLHNLAILEAVREATQVTGIQAHCIFTGAEARSLKLSGHEEYLLLRKTTPPPGMPSKYLDLHAGSSETGIMLNYFPTQVKKELAASLEPTAITIDDLKRVRQDGMAARRLIPSGYFGAPSGFNPVAGKEEVEILAVEYAELIGPVLKESQQKD